MYIPIYRKLHKQTHSYADIIPNESAVFQKKDVHLKIPVFRSKEFNVKLATVIYSFTMLSPT